MSDKHAYLILAHCQFDLLKKLIVSLDYEKNDFFIHIDKKVNNFNIEEFSNLTKFSKVVFIERKNLKWGDYSLVDAELSLLKEAFKNNYSYYHLLSGQDLPLLPADKIYKFFESKNNEFIRHIENKKVCEYRFKTYKLFTGKKNKFKSILTKLFDYLQIVLGINRIKKSKLTYLKGDQWFSITNALCGFVLKNEDLIQKIYKRTQCPDESVIQTIAYNSPFKSNIINNSLRYIDWTTDINHPKTLTLDDLEKINSSDKLFARKFDEEKSKELINCILEKILKK